MKLSEFKEAVRKVLRERSINAISKLQQKNVENSTSRNLENSSFLDFVMPDGKSVVWVNSGQEHLAFSADGSLDGGDYKGKWTLEGDQLSITANKGKGEATTTFTLKMDTESLWLGEDEYVLE